MIISQCTEIVFNFGFKNMNTSTFPDTARKIIPKASSYIGKKTFFTEGAYNRQSKTTYCAKSGVIVINGIWGNEVL